MMKPTLLLSDLHLAADRTATLAAFHAFARGPARDAAAVYVLGDLFDAWIGDDQRREPYARSIVRSLRGISDAGIALFIAHGNRDFLLGDDFATDAGATLLDEQTIIDLCGTPTLLTHGDEFCTGDAEYQRFRAFARQPRHQRKFLLLPYVLRRLIGARLRGGSRAATARKPESILDVTAAAVENAFRSRVVSRIIHGHTHRPHRHSSRIDGRACERIVLSDWDDHGHYLAVDAAGIHDRRIDG